MAILQPQTKVQFVQPSLVGEVVEAKIIDNGIQYLVDYTNDEGTLSQRWFKEEELQVV